MVPRNFYILIGITTAVFLFLSTFINRAINSSVHSSVPIKSEAPKDLLRTQSERSPEEIAAEADAKPVTLHNLSPDDPAKFGILVQKEGDVRSPNHWEQNVKRTLVASGALAGMEKSGALSSGVPSEKEFERRSRSIDERIREQERAIKNDPSDEEAQLKLQNLYMLKATLSAVGNKAATIPAKP